MRKLEDIKVWKSAMNVSLEVYRLTKHFPNDEKFGLTSQMRRCSVSIASNIAEGAGRNSNKEFNQFLSIANGSAYELQTQILLCTGLEFIQKEASDKLISKVIEIQKMIYGFQRSLN